MLAPIERQPETAGASGVAVPPHESFGFWSLVLPAEERQRAAELWERMAAADPERLAVLRQMVRRPSGPREQPTDAAAVAELSATWMDTMIRDVIEAGEPELVVVGAGSAGAALVKAMRLVGRPPAGLVDNASRMHGQVVEGLAVVSLESTIAEGYRAFAIASLSYAREMTTVVEAACEGLEEPPLIFVPRLPSDAEHARQTDPEAYTQARAWTLRLLQRAFEEECPWAALYLAADFERMILRRIDGLRHPARPAARPSPFVYAMQ